MSTILYHYAGLPCPQDSRLSNPARFGSSIQGPCLQLEDETFDKMFYSPLKRAAQTAKLVWGDSTAPCAEIPSLREIDLYSFQGLLKSEGLEQYGDTFKMWQKQPAALEIAGQRPVRELWCACHNYDD